MNAAAAVLVLTVLATSAQAASLIITVDNIRSAKGDIRLSLYASPAEWPENSAKDHDFVMKAQAGRIVFRLDVPPGTYAVNGFHDENGNGKFDTNFLGIPEEGYFFSNDAHPFLSAPGFDAVKFTVPSEGKAIPCMSPIRVDADLSSSVELHLPERHRFKGEAASGEGPVIEEKEDEARRHRA